MTDTARAGGPEPSGSGPPVTVPQVAAQAAGVPAAGPASQTLARLAAWFAVTMRAGIGLAAGAAALVGMVPPVDQTLVLTAVLVATGWLGLFSWVVVSTRRLPRWLVAGDVAMTAVLCAGHGWLVAPEALAPGTAWVAATATVSIVVANLAWRAAPAAGAGLVVIGAYLWGAALAEAPGHGAVQALMFLIQMAAAAVIMWLVRRAGRAADRALADHQQVRDEAALAAARRAAQRAHNRRLHDTALATLTMVGTGSVPTGTAALRQQAGRDLAAIRSWSAAEPAPRQPVPLDEQLRQAVAQGSPELAVMVTLAPGLVPGPVAEAFAGACGQALANIAAHAGTGRARVAMRWDGPRVTVEITDRGAGFETGTVPGHRLGVREGIIGRMESVGGWASVDSRPGGGTTVRLGWARD